MGDEMIARIEAEESLLGAILIEATATHSLAIHQVQSFVNWADFSDATDYDNKRTRIFKAMTLCPHPEIVSVAQKMQELKTMRQGDISYLHHLIAECPTSMDYIYYAKAVRWYARGTEQPRYAGIKV